MKFLYQLQPKMFSVPDKLLTWDSFVNSLKSVLLAHKNANILMYYKLFKREEKEWKNNHWVW